MALLYKNAKKEVDAEFDQLTKAGWRPVANDDGKTYSWVNAKGELYNGKLNPTPGIDPDAGFVKRNLTREARQNRLMSEKVTAMLAVKGKSSGSSEASSGSNGANGSGSSNGSGSGTSEGTKPDTEKKSFEKEDVSNIFRIPVDTTTAEENIKSLIPSPQLAAGPNVRAKGVSFMAPVYKEGEINRTDPYLYYEERDLDKVFPTGFSRFWNKKFGGADYNSIVAEHQGRSNSSIGMQNLGFRNPGTKVVDGKKYILAKNPNHEAGLYDVNDVAGLTTAIEKGGLTARMYPEDAESNRRYSQVTRDNKRYWKVEKSGNDILGNVFSAAQAMLIPKKVVVPLGNLPKTQLALTAGKGATQNANTIKNVEEVKQPVTETVKALKERLIPTGKQNPITSKVFQVGTKSATELPSASTMKALPPYVPTPKAPIPLGPGNTSSVTQAIPKQLSFLFRNRAGQFVKAQ